MKTVYTLLFSTYLFTSYAQWNSNTAINTPICVATGKQIDLRISEDGKGGAFIAWKDYRTGVPDIYVQRVNKYGVPLWTIDGVNICNDPADQSTPFICSDQNGGIIVAWSDWRSGVERDLYAQRVDSMGNVLWTTNGAIVANKPNREHNEKICSDGSGGAIFVWEQQNSMGLWDVWTQRLDFNGNPVWPVGGIPVTTASGNRINGRVKPDSKGGGYYTWQDLRSGTYDVYAQHVTANGVLDWGNSAIAVCTAIDAQTTPKIDADKNNNGAYITWIDSRNGVDYDIYAQKIDSAGNMLWTTNGVPVVAETGNQSAQDMQVGTLLNDLVVVWKDKRNGTDYNIYAQKLNSAGAPQWPTNGIIVCGSQKDQVNPNLVDDYAGGGVVVWQDSTITGGWDIKAQRFDGNGIMLWTFNGVDVGTEPSEQSSPKNCTDDNHGAIFAFQDKRSGTFDVYAHHLFYDGTTTVGLFESNSLIGDLSVYPNPFTNEFKIDFDNNNDSKIRIKICDILGNDVSNNFTYSLNSKSVLFKTNEQIPNGIYFINLFENEQIKTVRIVKSN